MYFNLAGGPDQEHHPPAESFAPAAEPEDEAQPDGEGEASAALGPQEAS